MAQQRLNWRLHTAFAAAGAPEGPLVHGNAGRNIVVAVDSSEACYLHEVACAQSWLTRCSRVAGQQMLDVHLQE